MYNDTASHDTENVSTLHQHKHDGSIYFRMRMICQNTKLLPCYRIANVWMVPITMLQQVYFPRHKLARLERIVTDCTKTKLKLMEKAEIDKMQSWLQQTENTKDLYPALTPREFSCCVEDLRENFEYIERVVRSGFSRNRNKRRDPHASREKTKDSHRHSYYYSSNRSNTNSIESGAQKRAEIAITDCKSKSKQSKDKVSEKLNNQKEKSVSLERELIKEKKLFTNDCNASNEEPRSSSKEQVKLDKPLQNELTTQLSCEEQDHSDTKEAFVSESNVSKVNFSNSDPLELSYQEHKHYEIDPKCCSELEKPEAEVAKSPNNISNNSSSKERSEASAEQSEFNLSIEHESKASVSTLKTFNNDKQTNCGSEKPKETCEKIFFEQPSSNENEPPRNCKTALAQQAKSSFLNTGKTPLKSFTCDENIKVKVLKNSKSSLASCREDGLQKHDLHIEKVESYQTNQSLVAGKSSNCKKFVIAEADNTETVEAEVERTVNDFSKNNNSLMVKQSCSDSKNSTENMLPNKIEKLKQLDSPISIAVTNNAEDSINAPNVKLETPIVSSQAAYPPYHFVPVVPMNLTSAVAMPSCFYLPIAESSANTSQTHQPLNEGTKQKPDKPTKVKNRNKNNNNTASCFSHVLDEFQKNRSAAKSDSNSSSSSHIKKKTKKHKKSKGSDRKVEKPVTVKSKVLSIRPMKSSINLHRSTEVKTYRTFRNFRTPQRSTRNIEYGKKLFEAAHKSMQQNKENPVDNFEEKDLDDKQGRSLENDTGAKFENESYDIRRHYNSTYQRSNVILDAYDREQIKNSDEIGLHNDYFTKHNSPENIVEKFANVHPMHNVKNIYKDHYPRQRQPEEFLKHPYAKGRPTEDQSYFNHAQHQVFSDSDSEVADSSQEFTKHAKHWLRGNYNQHKAFLSERFQDDSPYSERQITKISQQYWSNENHESNQNSPDNLVSIERNVDRFKLVTGKTGASYRTSTKPYTKNTHSSYSNYYRSKSVQRARSFLYNPNRYHISSKNVSTARNKLTKPDIEGAEKRDKAVETSVSESIGMLNPTPKLAGHKDLVRRVKSNVSSKQDTISKLSESALSDLISYIRKNNPKRKEKNLEKESITSGQSHHDNCLSFKVNNEREMLPEHAAEPTLLGVVTKSELSKDIKSSNMSEGRDQDELSPSCLSEFVTLDEEWENNEENGSCLSQAVFKSAHDLVYGGNAESNRSSSSKMKSSRSEKMQKKTSLKTSHISLSETKNNKDANVEAVETETSLTTNHKSEESKQQEITSSSILAVDKLIEKVEQGDLNEAEKTVKMFLQKYKKGKFTTSKWAFEKRESGWNDVFLDFSLNVDLTNTKDNSDVIGQDRSRIAQPMQWKKKLIEQIDMTSFYANQSNFDQRDVQSVEALKSDVSSTMSDILKVVEKRVRTSVNEKYSVHKLAKSNTDDPRTKKQKIGCTPSDLDIFGHPKCTTSGSSNTKIIQTPTNDRYSTVKSINFQSDASSKHLKKVDFYQAVSRNPVQVFYGGKSNCAIPSRQPNTNNDLLLESFNSNFLQVKKPFKNDVTASENSMVITRAKPIVANASTSTKNNRNTQSVMYNQAAKPRFCLVPENRTDEDDDASTYVPDEEERSSDETTSDSEKIPLRSYAKVPLWNNQDLLKAWETKKCIVNVEKLAIRPSNSSVKQVASKEYSSSSSDNECCNMPIAVSSVIPKISKAKKSIYRPNKSMFQKNEGGEIKPETITNNEHCDKNHTSINETNANTNHCTTRNISAVDLISDSIDVKSEIENYETKNSDVINTRSGAKFNPSSSTDIAKASVFTRLGKRRTELPSVSSDEEELTRAVEEKLDPSLKSTTASPEGCSDDDVLLISCKPYLSKDKKEQRNDAKLEKRKSDYGQVGRQVRRNKARKKAVSSKSVKKNIIFRDGEKSLAPESCKTALKKLQVQYQEKITALASENHKLSKGDGSSISYSLEAAAETNLNTLDSSTDSRMHCSATENILGKIVKDYNALHDKDNVAQNSETNCLGQSGAVDSSNNFQDSLKSISTYSFVSTNLPSNVSTNHIVNSNIDEKKKATFFQKKDQTFSQKQCDLEVTTKDVYALDDANSLQEPNIVLPVVVDSRNIKQNADYERHLADATKDADLLRKKLQQQPSTQVKADTEATTAATSSVFQFKTATSIPSPLITLLTSGSSQTQVKQSTMQTSLTSIFSESQKILSPLAHSVFGETYHHGMLEITLNAPAAYLQLGRRFQGKILPQGIMAFIRRRIPYIQVRLNQSTLKTSPPPSYGAAITENPTVGNTDCSNLKSPADYSHESEAGTLLIRMRDAAFSLKMDSKNMLQQVVDFQIRCYIPNNYTQSVYDMVYNQVAVADDKMKTLLGLQHPVSKAALNENSMMHLNDYLKIILPNFYVQKFKIYKDDLPNYVSVTTYKPIDVVTPIVIETFSQSYAYNRTLIDGDISIKTHNQLMTASEFGSNANPLKKRVISKRKSSDSNSLQPNAPKMPRSRKTAKQRSIAAGERPSVNAVNISSNSSFINTAGNLPHQENKSLIQLSSLFNGVTQSNEPMKLLQSRITHASISNLLQNFQSKVIETNGTQLSIEMPASKKTLNCVTSVRAVDGVDGQSQQKRVGKQITKDDRLTQETVVAQTAVANKDSSSTARFSVLLNANESNANSSMPKEKELTIGARFVNGDHNITPLQNDSAMHHFLLNTYQSGASSSSVDTNNSSRAMKITVQPPFDPNAHLKLSSVTQRSSFNQPTTQQNSGVMSSSSGKLQWPNVPHELARQNFNILAPTQIGAKLVKVNQDHGYDARCSGPVIKGAG